MPAEKTARTARPVALRIAEALRRSGLLFPWRKLLPVLLVAAYALWLWPHAGAVASGSDSSGYFNHARMLARGDSSVAQRTVPGLAPGAGHEMLYVPLGFRPGPGAGLMVPTYPAGLPLMIAAAAPLAGWNHAADVVILLHAGAGVLLALLLGRAFGLSRRWAALGALVIAVSPLYLTYALQAMSDLPAAVWTMLAVWLAWRSRGHAGWALAAGAAIAMAVLIRPTDALIIVPVALAVGASPRRWILLALGGMPGAVWLLAHNQALYGHLLTTGYGDIRSLFSARWIPLALWHYLRWLPALFTPAVLLVPALPWVARRAPRETAVLGSWALVFPALYAAYFCTPETWWYLRFLLPAAPALVLGGLRVAQEVAGRWGPASPPAAAFPVACALVVVNATFWMQHLDALEIGRNEQVYPETAAWLQARLPPHAVLAGLQVTGALEYYTDFAFVRFDQIGSDDFPHLREALEKAGRPLVAVLWPHEVVPALRQAMPGHWTQIAAVRDVTVWQLARGAAGEVSPCVLGPLQVSPAPAQRWTLPVAPGAILQRAVQGVNGAAWLALGACLAPFLLSKGWKGWLAWAGVILTAGALTSVRLGTTDLVALLAVAAALQALERDRPALATGCLAIAALVNEFALLALPCLWRRPWVSASNFGRTALVAAPILLWSAAGLWWAPAANWNGHLFSLPFVGLLAEFGRVGGTIRAGQASFTTGINLLTALGLGAQAAFFLSATRRDSGSWRRLGWVFAGAMLFLGPAVWRAQAGDAARLFLPMTLAFNRLALGRRRAATWLLAGNAAAAAGLLSLARLPDRPLALAAVGAGGQTSVVLPRADWLPREDGGRHEWVWGLAHARLDIESRPADSRRLLLDFSLRSLQPRLMTVQSSGQVLWRGLIGRALTRLSVPISLRRGRATVEITPDPEGAPGGPGGPAAQPSLALYDPAFRAR